MDDETIEAEIADLKEKIQALEYNLVIATKNIVLLSEQVITMRLKK